MVLDAIKSTAGITALQLAYQLRRGNEPVYDSHRRVSFAIARLRQSGLVQDVERCQYCNRALTRNNRNVKLYAISYAPPATPRQLAIDNLL